MKTRILHTDMHFEDEWFNTLSIGYRYLFIYLFTNTHIGHTGAYKLTERVALLETGADSEVWQDALKKFEEAGKIKLIGEYIFIINAQKHSNYSGPKNESAYKAEFSSLPQEVQDTIAIQYKYCTDTTINQKPKIINNKSETINKERIEKIKTDLRKQTKSFRSDIES